MEDVGEMELLPDRKYTFAERARRWYARYFYEILENIFMLTAGLMFLCLFCWFLEVMK